MQIGASTSCFYPLETEKALEKVIDLGFNSCEIFFNSVSELEEPFVKDMKKTADSSGVRVLSVHPFSSSLESTCIFGEYERRYRDYIDLYKKHFYASALLGADIVVIHGSIAKQKRLIPDEFYFERFASLIELGKKEGVRVCQENVVRFKSQNLDFMKRMKDYLGDDFNMVFDVKQSIRSGYNPLDFASEMKDSIVHLHLSDNTADCDCLPPGKGNFDFNELFEMVNDDVNAVIEIYSKGLDVEKELKESRKFFETIG